MVITIYRKYRPKKFSEISGQKHIVKTLTNAIIHDRIGHAYLLTGPRGTGKTTLARIFAKTINCLEPVKQEKDTQVKIEPCNKCKSCKLILEDRALDLIEIDAASHTGVDNIRQLKEAIPLPPTALKYKVYIIDEVHMLSTGAFNALLKTLEEPPAHAIFILATTELHKVPETIVSRCQRFDVSNLSTNQIIERLGQIAKAEKVEVDKEVLETIALEAEGGMRDAESLFGQILSLEDKKITAREAHDILGTSPRKLAIDFVHELLDKNTNECLTRIDKLEGEGVNLKNFNKLILTYLRNLTLLKANSEMSISQINFLSKQQIETSKKKIENIKLSLLVFLLELFQKSLTRFKGSTIPQLPLELAIIEFSLEEKDQEKQSVPPQAPVQKEKMSFLGNQESFKTNAPQKNEASNSSASSLIQDKDGNKKQNRPAEVSESTTKNQIKSGPTKVKKKKEAGTSRQIPAQSTEPFNKSLEDVLECWSEILEKMKPHNHSISAFLKNCTPCGIKNGNLYIKTKYDFYKDKLGEVSNRLTVEKVIGTIMDTSVRVNFITEKECQTIDFNEEKSSSENHNPLHDAMQVFGGRIVK